MKIAPSLLSCNFAKMGEELRRVDNAGADLIHLDVMDGNFVPNISFGAPVIKAIRPFSKKPFDVHLMIADPLKYIDDFAQAGADIITFHAEANSDTDKTIAEIKRRGISAGIAINPKTPPGRIFDFLGKVDIVLVMTVEPGFGGQSFMSDMLVKIAHIKAEAARIGADIEIEVDGGINRTTIGYAARAGADICVAGTSVFQTANAAAAISELKKHGIY